MSLGLSVPSANSNSADIVIGVAETCDTQHTLTERSQPCATFAGGGDADGVEYANALAQASFRAVAVAATDVATVFQKDAPELSSLFLVWALQETQR